MTRDSITLADEAEERSAADALRAAKNVRDLGMVFTRDCDCFEGAAYDRLYALFMERMRKMGALQP